MAKGNSLNKKNMIELEILEHQQGRKNRKIKSIVATEWGKEYFELLNGEDPPLTHIREFKFCFVSH